MPNDGSVRIAVLVREPFASKGSATGLTEIGWKGSLLGHIGVPSSGVPVVQLCDLRVGAMTRF